MLGNLAAAHLLATLFMTGVIWFVQVVHYPLFAQFRGADYPAFQRAHERRTTWVVGPAMALEVLSTFGLTVIGWSQLSRPLLAIGLILLAGLWLSTALLQVPRHRRLESGFDKAAHRFLVKSNWIRTAAWTARTFVALALLREAWRAGPA